ncbi:hypothetical protein ACFVAV_01505 [Nocardia sp. NPDC057663]|uniref:hypothetical protein n=1 Tax=Nocardia sp. NPDC057663 TaxID=3346201 RepID=UPI00367081E3
MSALVGGEARDEFVARVCGGWRDASSLGDQIDCALDPDRLPKADGEPQARLSAGAWVHPVILAALERALLDEENRLRTTFADDGWYARHLFDWEHSNLPDRRPMSAEFGCGETDCDDFGHAGTLAATAGESRDSNRAIFGTGLAAATTGPAGCRAVVLHDPNAPMFTPRFRLRYWREWVDGTPTVIAYPIPPGYTAERVSRVVFHQFATRCYWCCTRVGKGPHDGGGMMVDCGGAVHVFPTCRACADKFDTDLHDAVKHCYDWPKERRARWRNDAQLDYVTDTNWDHATGWPADRWR